MLATLKNGRCVEIRRPTPSDAEDLVRVMTMADRESRFLAREIGEFDCTVEDEVHLLERIAADADGAWFVAVVDGHVVGQGSVHRVGRRSRMRHRATLGFVLRRDFWGLGIGSRLMEACLAWCRENGVEQAELEVVSENARAIALYTRYGMRATGRIPAGIRYADGTYADLLQMVVNLKEAGPHV